MQKYASKKSMIDETNYDISFEKLYKMVTLTNPSVVLAIDNPDVAKILQLIRTSFNA